MVTTGGGSDHLALVAARARNLDPHAVLGRAPVILGVGPDAWVFQLAFLGNLSLERLGESVNARATFSTELNKSDGGTGGNGSGKNGIGWARIGKSKTTSKQLYRGDWNTRPIHDMEFPPLARLLIAVSEELNSSLGLEGDKRFSLRFFAEYGSVLGMSFLMLIFWLFFG